MSVVARLAAKKAEDERLAALMAQLDPPRASLSDEDFAKLLVDSPEQLDLRKKDLGCAGVEKLASTFAEARHSHILELDLEGNGIGDAGVISLVNTAGDSLPKLAKLFLNDNEIGGAGLAGLATALTGGSFAHIDTLDLNRNRFGNGGLAALGGAISKGALARLRKLYVSGNGFDDQGLISFSHSIGGVGMLPQLDQLWLSKNGIGDEGATAFFGALGKGGMPALGDLRMMFNRIGDAGIGALLGASRDGALQRLWYLGLSDNAFSDEGLGALEVQQAQIRRSRIILSGRAGAVRGAARRGEACESLAGLLSWRRGAPCQCPAARSDSKVGRPL